MQQQIEKLIELREYCRTHKWPRLAQWQHWIYSRNPIALACVKKVGGRYIINLEAFNDHVQSATIE